MHDGFLPTCRDSSSVNVGEFWPLIVPSMGVEGITVSSDRDWVYEGVRVQVPSIGGVRLQ